MQAGVLGQELKACHLLTSCITTCNFDVDVDLLFQENSTIGQKTALSEKILSVLPGMKCLHQLEPHQIQGMDFINLLPVVQWVVKRIIETKGRDGWPHPRLLGIPVPEDLQSPRG